MDIYILRDGKEIGPFTEETTQTLLKQGSIREVDYAWHPGLPKWIPLTDVLNPATPSLETPPPPPPTSAETPLPSLSPAANLPKAGESATEKQKALLGYLGIPFSSELSKDQAALLVNDAMEDSKNATRLAQWNTDRLKLHPDLFSAEIQARKESRANDFFEICQTEGVEYFTKITKAHCQVLVGYLDVKFPNWDEEGKGAADKYFYPAVAEKFPQLVAKQWKGKLRYATGPKIAAELNKQRPSTGKLRKRRPATALPLLAIGRGLVFGAIILGMFFFVQKVLNASGSKSPAPAGGAASGQSAKPAPAPAAAVNPEALPPIEPEKAIAQADLGNPAAVPALPADPLMAVPVNPAATPAFPPDPSMAPPADPLMAAPANPAAVPVIPADPTMPADPLAPKPTNPLPGFPPDPPMANAPSLTTPDPLAPANPAVAPIPAVPAAAPADPGAAVKTNLKLTKPVEVQLAYGKMKLPAGTPVKLVSRDGNIVKVNYLNTVIVVPVTSTDFGAADAPPAPVAPTPASIPAPAPAPAPGADL
jgi:GYF domain 2